MSRITEVSDPSHWQSLRQTWLFEGKPVMFSKGNVHYKVIQNTEGEIEFEVVTEVSLYDSTSIS